MDLLLVTNLYPPQELGGYGRCMADFCWGLLQLGHRVQVISSDAPYLGPSGPGPSGEPVSRCLTLKG
ncbi:MAG: glycosyltransferase family 4 protein, partial [Cyanobacteria bacterium K_DeepCast_35m_m1_288]|nr:glycosyltransferase family 4 protein [Cyanobacteria bacterium K_DeepCast_35m_m1_288]